MQTVEQIMQAKLDRIVAIARGALSEWTNNPKSDWPEAPAELADALRSIAGIADCQIMPSEVSICRLEEVCYQSR